MLNINGSEQWSRSHRTLHIDVLLSCSAMANAIYRLDLSPQLVAQVLLKRALGPDELYVGSVLQHLLFLLERLVFLLRYIRETPLLGDDYLLAARELVACPAECLHDNRGISVFASDGKDDLANVDASDSAVWLAPCSTHSSLQTIRTSAGQHLVDTNNMERMHADPHVERVLPRRLGYILVGANTGSFKGFT